MKRWLLLTVILFALLITACGGQPDPDDAVSATEPDRQAAEEPAADENAFQQEDERILIAYFTRLDNTDGEIDDIIRGGGPYGEIGDSLEDADMDAISSASITIYNDQIQGNTQIIAQMIQENVGGDLFSIRAKEQYPADYDELIDLGGEEEAEDVRPELISHVENMAVYDIIFLGYPKMEQGFVSV